MVHNLNSILRFISSHDMYIASRLRGEIISPFEVRAKSFEIKEGEIGRPRQICSTYARARARAHVLIYPMRFDVNSKRQRDEIFIS